MCGVFGYIGLSNNAPKIVLSGLKNLEYRGYDSWGVASVQKTITVKKKPGKIGGANVNDLPNATIAIGHTRWATHGGVTKANAHPHLDCSNEIVLIHNGIFENYAKIKKGLMGHNLKSETDSEVIVHMLEGSKNNFLEKVRKTFNRMHGMNSIVVSKTNENELIAAKNGSPLVVGFGNKENYIASDASALLPYTQKVYFMEDGEIAQIRKDKVIISDVKTKKIKKIKIQKLKYDVSKNKLGKFKHFMHKEINEQPRIISEISTTSIHQNLISTLKKSKEIYLIGCGTAFYAALSGSYLFSKIAKIRAIPKMASEFVYETEFLKKDSCVIVISQSGETMDTIEAVKKAKSKGAKIITLTNSLGSTLYRMSHYNVLLGAGTEKAVASTKALTAMISHLMILAYSLNGKGLEGKKDLLRSTLSIESLFKQIPKIQILSKKLMSKEHVFVIGRGISYPTSLETALKIKEISYIHAEGFAGGELKHGPLALIETGTPVIVFLPNDETYNETLSSAMEAKARGGYVIGVSFKGHEIFDYYLPVKDVGVSTIIPNIIFGQLLSYYLTINRKLDPDKPRNLAKSVTVK